MHIYIYIYSSIHLIIENDVYFSKYFPFFFNEKAFPFYLVNDIFF